MSKLVTICFLLATLQNAKVLHADDVCIVLGGEATLHCAVANASSMIHWLHNGDLVVTNGVLKENLKSKLNFVSTEIIRNLTILDMLERDAGNYECISNEESIALYNISVVKKDEDTLTCFENYPEKLLISRCGYGTVSHEIENEAQHFCSFTFITYALICCVLCMLKYL